MKYVRRYNHRKEMLKWKRFKKKYPKGFVKLKAEWTFPENPTDEQIVNNFCQIILALNQNETTPIIITKNGGNQ